MTARQMEHYNKHYGAPPVLGQPAPESLYQPRSTEPVPGTTIR